MSDQPYQVMPELDPAEYDALKASIAGGYDPARPIVVDEHGQVLDGHHRQRVCAELGIVPPTVTLPGLTEDQKHDYAMRANLACRHLSQAQKRDLIRAELDRDDSRSDREIGRLVGADHKTVGSVRRGEIPQPEPQVTREEAERITAGIVKMREDLDADIACYLLRGGPPALLARELLGLRSEMQAESKYAMSPEIFDETWEAFMGKRIDAVLAWPSGAYAQPIEREGRS